MRLITVPEVDSTNEYLKRVPFESHLFVRAEAQTAGRGRRGKSWLSLKGKGIYLSGMFPALKAELVSVAGLAFGVAVVRALRTLSDAFYLKWPNDVHINCKKVAGVLPENTSDRLVVGVGVNISYGPEELSAFEYPATSLLAEGIDCDTESLTTALVNEISAYYLRLTAGDFSVKEFEDYCPMLGKEVVVLKGALRVRGRVLGVDAQGYLIVEGESGLMRLHHGDVSVRLKSCGS